MSVEELVVPVPDHPNLEVVRITGVGQGPTLAILAGVHGDEPEGVAAARRLVAEIPALGVCGNVIIVPVSSPAAFDAGTRESPLDGGNLARMFPGRERGPATQRLAHVLTETVIAQADLLVDLHSAGRDYRMPFFVGACDDGSPTGAASVEAARAFSAPITWAHDSVNPGRSLSAALERGVPAIYVESGGGGPLAPADVEGYVQGVVSVMAHMGMTASPMIERRDGTELRGGSGDVDAGLRAVGSGLVVPTVIPGEAVMNRQVIANLWTQDESRPRPIMSPRDGTIMMIRWRSQIWLGDVVAMIGPPSGPEA